MESKDPQNFDHRDAATALIVPVVAELFHQVSGPTFVKKCDLRPRLEAIGRLLQWVDQDAFLEQFDSRALEYFYEPFLGAFDPNLRAKLGIWYTPREIASYQVARIDAHLRSDLGIEDGLASEEVIILDPAVGTGTYLRAVLDYIYEFHRSNDEPDTIAASRTKTAATSRVIGFEVLPAAFVVAHLHLTHYLSAKGAPLQEDERLRIYLTNSLVGWGEKAVPPDTPLPGLKEELRQAIEVKGYEPVLVVLGNPPYQGFSAAESPEEKQLMKEWIDPLWPEWGVRKHRLGDLYVRFWRVAIRKIAEMTSRGVVSFITNRKWLGGRSFPAMRQDILHRFQLLVIDDLHGDVHDGSHPGDGSIFTTSIAAGIQRGVSIVTAVRGNEPDGEVAKVRRRDLWGSGAEKRAQLDAFTKSDLDSELKAHETSRKKRWRLVATTSGDDPPLDDYFEFVLSGVQPVREEAVCDDRPVYLEDRMREYFDSSVSDEKLFNKWPAFAIKRSRYQPKRTRKRLLHDSAFEKSRVIEFLFKPLDGRWLYWETRHKLLNEARLDLVPCFLRAKKGGFERITDQVVIVAPQTPRRLAAARPAVTTGVPGFHAVDPDARAIPRLSPSGQPETAYEMTLAFDSGEPKSNVRDEWIAAARSQGCSGSNLEIGDLVFYALIAIMYSPSWVETLGTDNDDFACVPIPNDAEILRDAARIGKEIASLLDPFTPVPGVTSGEIHKELSKLAVPDSGGSVELTAGGVNGGGRYIAADEGAILWSDESGWRNIPIELWDFTIGGFSVLSKWLGYRHYNRTGVPLTDQQVEEFTQLCRRIAAVISLNEACNKIYAKAAEDTLDPEKPAG